MERHQHSLSQRESELNASQPGQLRGPERGLNGKHGLLEAERGKRYTPGYSGLGLQRGDADPFSLQQSEPAYRPLGAGADMSLSTPSNLGTEQALYQQRLSRDRSPHRGLSRELTAYPGLSPQRAAYPELSRELVSYPSLSRELISYPPPSRELISYPEFSRERAELSKERVSYPELSRELLSYPPPSRELISYRELPRERIELSRERVSYPELSGERFSYPELSSERASYTDLYRGRTSYPGLSRESLPTWSPARNLPSNEGTTSLSSSLRNNRDTMTYTEQLCLPTRDRGRGRSPLTSRDPACWRGSRLDGHQSSRSQSNHKPAYHFKDRSPDRSQSFKEVGILMRKVPVAPPVKKSGRRKPAGSVIRVDGFPPYYEESNIKGMLIESLQIYGTVTYVEVCKAPGKPHALVFFSEKEASDVVIRKATKEPLFSKVLTISPWVMLPANKDRPVSLANTRVMYLENIHPLVTAEDLRKVCEPYGEVLDIEIKKNAKRPRSNNAIVQFWDITKAKIAARELHFKKIRNCIVKTMSGRNTVSKCVWVDGLPEDVEERRLLKPFEECGIVEKHLFDRKRGAALILYGAILPARQCVRSMENGKTSIGGKFIQVDYANGRAQGAFCRAMEKSGQDIGDFLFV